VRKIAVAVVLAATTAVAGASAATTVSRVVAKSVRSKTLGRTILVTPKGMTLYSLSAEKHGRFICTTKVCLSLWTPLVVPRGTTPTGAKTLATVRRPDGRFQVTYRGLPLYTFANDRKPGDAKGNGFKDVGTWLAASAAAPKPAAPAAGGGYGYATAG
jgi:predicted lipoprotein with Yx(FWY)xxD motif